jgi:hypothetical protein
MTRSKLATMALVVGLAMPYGANADDPPGTFKIPGTETTLKFNGFAEASFVYDLSGDNAGEVYLNSPSIALDGQPTNTPSFKSAVAYTRFGAQSMTPSSAGTVGFRFEGDFAFTSGSIGYNAVTGPGSSFTHSTPFRVRHAYSTLGEWLLIGQTWSTFADLNAFPDQQDENPVYNLAPLRAPMVRVGFPAGPAKVTLAVEDPYAQSVSTYHSIPDFIARLDVPTGAGSFSVRGVTKQFKNSTQSAQGFGAAIGTAIKLSGDTLVIDVSGGTGMGAYQAATVAGPVAEDAIGSGTDVKLWNTAGASVGYTHVWCPQLRSNLIGSGFWAQNSSDVRNAVDAAAAAAGSTSPPFANANQEVLTGMFNTYWSFAKNFWVGAEYALSHRKNFGGQSGNEHRVELTSHVDLF